MYKYTGQRALAENYLSGKQQRRGRPARFSEFPLLDHRPLKSRVRASHTPISYIAVGLSRRGSTLRIKTERFSFKLELIPFTQMQRRAIKDVVKYLEKMHVIKLKKGGNWKSRIIDLQCVESTKRSTVEKEGLPACCFACHENKNLTKHHVVPLSRGGTNTCQGKWNIVRLCTDCHRCLNNAIHTMEQDTSKPLCYLDYVAVLVDFALKKMRDA